MGLFSKLPIKTKKVTLDLYYLSLICNNLRGFQLFLYKKLKPILDRKVAFALAIAVKILLWRSAAAPQKIATESAAAGNAQNKI